MPIQTYTARIAESLALNEKFQHLKLELVDPHRIEFTAGQYIILEVPGSDQKKDYSIASAPAIDHAIELFVDIEPKGAGTRYIAALKPGDEVQFMAPAGRFVIEPQETEIGRQEKALVFIATGSGITSLRSMILDQLQTKHDTRKIVLYWGLRYLADACWIDDFHELEEMFPNFSLHLVFSQAGEEWTLCRGHVTDCLSIHPMIEYAGYYICGNNTMIQDVQKLLLSKGVVQEHIHYEKYY